VRTDLLQRLRERRPEIEEAVLARVNSVEDPTAVDDVEYERGLKGAVHTALDYAIGALDGGATASDPIPAELTAQARLAARNAVDLDAVLLRYLAGHALICDFLLQEGGREPAELRRALRTETALFERILAEVADAYRQQVEQRNGGAERRCAEQVKRLLAGEPQDALEFRYDLDLWHLGLVATGAETHRGLRELAAALDRRLLVVRPGGTETWAWLGGRRPLAAGEVAERVRADSRSELVLAIGEPGRGISGWRLTHRQARAALPVALRGERRVVGYSDVALLASVFGDEVLTSSLTELYLTPLAAERDGGATLRQTLRAYFASGRNVTSAAAALGVSRQTVNSRLHAVEERIGRPLNACGTEVDTALRLSDLRNTPSTPLTSVK
jgi:PucR C-terminal helix-turn-helix domain/GGDEF-like domain